MSQILKRLHPRQTVFRMVFIVKMLISVLLLSLVTSTLSQHLCGSLCDGDPSSRARNPRAPHSVSVFERVITIHISDQDNVAFGSMSNGSPGDEVWLDRTFDGGLSWSDNSRIGNSPIPSGAHEVTTPVFNIDGDLMRQQIGALRACGKAQDRDDTVCTNWARSTVHAETPVKAAATALMQMYNNEGLWKTIGWWNAANSLTALISYISLTNDRTYFFAIDNTYVLNINGWDGNYLSDSIDDTAWWGLVWLEAYKLTGEQKYLNNAQLIADYMYTFVDGRCGGGVYWSAERTYKNAVTNELFIKLAAGIHNQIPGDNKYQQQATEVWNWFNASGMINNDNLINDGLDTLGSCKNNGQETWTYNQGIILGGLAQLYVMNNNLEYLRTAAKIATAVINSGHLSPNGILHEPCDNGNDDCGPNAPVFKGVFARNLLELIEVARSASGIDTTGFVRYINNNAEAILRNGNSLNQYGLSYEGPYHFMTASTQQSAFEMILASWRLSNL